MYGSLEKGVLFSANGSVGEMKRCPHILEDLSVVLFNDCEISIAHAV